jgi:hypothetical protein
MVSGIESEILGRRQIITTALRRAFTPAKLKRNKEPKAFGLWVRQ